MSYQKPKKATKKLAEKLLVAGMMLGVLSPTLSIAEDFIAYDDTHQELYDLILESRKIVQEKSQHLETENAELKAIEDEINEKLARVENLLNLIQTKQVEIEQLKEEISRLSEGVGDSLFSFLIPSGFTKDNTLEEVTKGNQTQKIAIVSKVKTELENHSKEMTQLMDQRAILEKEKAEFYKEKEELEKELADLEESRNDKLEEIRQAKSEVDEAESDELKNEVGLEHYEEENKIPSQEELKAQKEKEEQERAEAESKQKEEQNRQASSGSSSTPISSNAAKEEIARRESNGSYDAYNPGGPYIGRYQLHISYLNGDHSPENQERVADQYVTRRYGSWEKALEFWNANGWY